MKTDPHRPRPIYVHTPFWYCIAFLLLLCSMCTCYWLSRHLTLDHGQGGDTPPPLKVVKVNPAEACANWRWVGETTEAVCPAGPNDDWTETGELDAPFCIYEHTDAGGNLAADPIFRSKFNKLDRDCQGVVPLGAPVDQQRNDYFLGALGVPDDKIDNLIRSVSARPRLAILDTAPTNAVDPEADESFLSPHGYSLVHFAKRLLCVDETPGKPELDLTRDLAPDTLGDPEEKLLGDPCAAKVVTRLALPRTLFHATSKRASGSCAGDCEQTCGGSVGMITDLAIAIRQELEAWRESNDGEPLIVNLSVGWDGEFFGGLDPFETASSKAVFSALCEAAQEDALVVAAAGNRRWGPEEAEQAVLPAAWEALEDWQALCVLAIGDDFVDGSAINPNSSFAPDYRPLLYAAGGVDANNNPLMNSRPIVDRPRLLAFADHAAVRPWGENPEPEVLTGTSMGALGVSAAAAAVWRKNDDWNRHEVMTHIYETAETVGESADLFWGPPASKPDARRINFCKALRSTGEACPALMNAFPYQPDATGYEQVSVSSLQTMPIEDLCGSTFFTLQGEVLEFPCPHWQLPGMQTVEGVHPQPGSDLCPDCSIVQGASLTGGPVPGTVYLDFSNLIPIGADLAILAIGEHIYEIDLEVYWPQNVNGNINGNENWPPQIAVTLNQPFTKGDLAVIAIEVDGERSMVSPLFVP